MDILVLQIISNKFIPIAYIMENESEATKRTSIIDNIGEITKDQDFKQKTNVASTLVLEFYRVLMGSLLLFFVPQDCDGEICTFSQNYNREDNGMSKTAFAANLLTLASFIYMYKIEVQRENSMIDYLHVNPDKARTNDAVEEALSSLPLEIKNKIWDFDKKYMLSGYFSMGAFSLNAIISTIVVLQNYMNDKTATALLTNLLFMGMKLNDVYSTVHTEKNIFLSAYLTRKIQYNDVDPDAPVLEQESRDGVSVSTSVTTDIA
jgi:hypothetical protein